MFVAGKHVSLQAFFISWGPVISSQGFPDHSNPGTPYSSSGKLCHSTLILLSLHIPVPSSGWWSLYSSFSRWSYRSFPFPVSLWHLFSSQMREIFRTAVLVLRLSTKHWINSLASQILTEIWPQTQLNVTDQHWLSANLLTKQINT